MLQKVAFFGVKVVFGLAALERGRRELCTLGITIFRDGTGRNGTGQLRGLLTNLRDGTESRKLPILRNSTADE